MCALCIVFILWRRASTLRKVVAHRYARSICIYLEWRLSGHVLRLNTWTQKQGTIRLSEDDGPPAIEFYPMILMRIIKGLKTTSRLP
ncbi:uncharacterized protein B0H18DRAFT_523511 [Fomitopsis serialis]|uniref:uncharacterized protein n=1 Tax=Fomitopsis serialis TaxID=139415 RepID=UPI002007C3BA|nr:uncharacterized protein B0H18DRAFT_523511 [Neoantrodia serialis]KAH9922244.1 hypothetical protein B0H18DRAFT_523511 [Neoantrodia serialis]